MSKPILTAATEESTALRGERGRLLQVDRTYENFVYLYVALEENPIDALVRIREHLARETGNFARTVSVDSVAAAVVCIERVIARLDECRIEHVYRRTK